MKIFGIGLNKTGTSTLGAAGALMGFSCKTWDPALFRETLVEDKRDALWATIDAFDLFNDFPYPLVYREIDARYPTSKFILTRRTSPEAWLASLKAHAMRGSLSTRTHKIVYGWQYPHGRERAFLDYYKRHNDEARRYFENRPEDFLEICWEEETDWARLAGFLGKPSPSTPLPKTNAREAKSINPVRYAWNLAARFLQNAGAA